MAGTGTILSNGGKVKDDYNLFYLSFFLIAILIAKQLISLCEYVPFCTERSGFLTASINIPFCTILSVIYIIFPKQKFENSPYKRLNKK